MKWLYAIGTVAVVGAGCFCAGWFGRGCNEPSVVVKWKTETVTKYIKTPAIDFRYCYESPMNITATQKGNNVEIIASDRCKSGMRTMAIKVPAGIKRNAILIQPLIMFGYNSGLKRFDVPVGFSVSYYRTVLGPLAVGGGVSYLHHPISKDSYYGINIGILALF